ncbi:MAG: sugar phosphate isomerase/epimerase family protein [Candidatus Hadarchaeia archaeon]
MVETIQARGRATSDIQTDAEEDLKADINICGVIEYDKKSVLTDKFTELAEAGFNKIGIRVTTENYECLDELLGNTDEISNIRNVAENYRLAIDSVSIEDDVLNKRRENMDGTFEDLQPYIDFASKIGSNVLNIVNHKDRDLSGSLPEYLYDAIRTGLAQLEEKVIDKDLRIAIENNSELPATANDCNAVLLGTNPEKIGICFDPVNYVKAIGRKPETDSTKIIRELGERIFHVCFRQMPLKVRNEERLVNYNSVVRALKKQGYEGAISIDVDKASRTIGMDLERIAKYLNSKFGGQRG